MLSQPILKTAKRILFVSLSKLASKMGQGIKTKEKIMPWN